MSALALTLQNVHTTPITGDFTLADKKCPTLDSGSVAASAIDQICDGLDQKNCALAISQGSCGVSTALFPAGQVGPQIASAHSHLVFPLQNGYRSIILDTLTPPPNTSLAR